MHLTFLEYWTLDRIWSTFLVCAKFTSGQGLYLRTPYQFRAISFERIDLLVVRTMNGTSIESFTLPFRPLPVVIFESACAVLITILAGLGNVLVFAAFAKERTLRTEPNILLLNLCAADFVSAVVSLPLLSRTLVLGSWTLGPRMCRLQAFQSYASYICNLITMTVISVCRYFATARPLTCGGQLFGGKSLLLVIVSTWVISLLTAMTPLIGWGEFRFEPSYALCMHDHSASTSYNILQLLLLLVSASVITASYVQISRVIRSRRLAPMRLSRGIQERFLLKQTEKVTNTVLMVVVFFGIGYAPTLVLGFFVLTAMEVTRSARMLSTFSMSLTCCTNPVVYWIRNKKLRRTLRALACQKCCHVNNAPGRRVASLERWLLWGKKRLHNFMDGPKNSSSLCVCL